MRARYLPEEEQAIVAAVAHWVDREVRPHAGRLEREQQYPTALIDEMKTMGVFGLAVPDRWSESAVSTPCFALVTEELARGWMSLAGAMGGHSVVARLLARYGTPEQQERWLPRMERYFRDAPLMIVGEGTNEIQRTVIVEQLVRRGGLPD